MSALAAIPVITLTIDPEFQRLLPDLDEATLKDLESDIVAHGIREPLVVWAEQGILLDGHNRYAIARKHDIVFDTDRRSFSDRNAAADWIDKNQSMRRNLTPDQMTLIRGRRYNRNKKPSGGQVGNPGNRHGQPRRQNDTAVSTPTRVLLAIDHGVSPETILRDGKFASAVEQLKSIDPDIEKKVVSGRGPTRKRITAAAMAETPEEAKAILFGRTKPIAQAPLESKLEKQRGFKTYARRAPSARADSAMTALETSLECLAEIAKDELLSLLPRIEKARRAIGVLKRRISE